jgi:hypothetical protein
MWNNAYFLNVTAGDTYSYLPLLAWCMLGFRRIRPYTLNKLIVRISDGICIDLWRPVMWQNINVGLIVGAEMVLNYCKHAKRNCAHH